MKRLEITSSEDSILGKNTLKLKGEIIRSSFVRWTIQLLMQYERKRIIETHYLWLWNCKTNVSAIRYVLRSFDKHDEHRENISIIGITAANGWEVVDDRSFSYVRVDSNG